VCLSLFNHFMTSFVHDMSRLPVSTLKILLDLRCVHHHPGDGVNAQNCSGGNQTMRWSGWDALQKCAAVCEAEEAL
jgi:hypothetical protein